MSGMNYALLKHEICGILGTRHVGYPQVGTSHVLKISAILKSLYSVSSLPFESGAFVDLMIFFFPPQDFLQEVLGLFTSRFTQILPECGSWAVTYSVES